MKFTSAFASLAILLFPTLTLADTVTVAYDTAYDNASASLDTVACSDGANGLITRGFSTFGSLPSFPRIGAAAAVGGWNSTSCGTCWEISYTDGSGTTRTVDVLAIDHAGDGFNLSEEAMNTLTGGNAVQFGRVNAQATQVAASKCGL